VPALCVDGVETCGIHESEVSLSENLIVLDDDEREPVLLPFDDLEVESVVVNGQHVLSNLLQHALLNSATTEVPVETSSEGPHAVADLAAVHAAAACARVTIGLATERAENLLLDVLAETRKDVADARCVRQKEVALMKLGKVVESLSTC